jgi:hypothetical protein
MFDETPGPAGTGTTLAPTLQHRYIARIAMLSPKPSNEQDGLPAILAAPALTSRLERGAILRPHGIDAVAWRIGRSPGQQPSPGGRARDYVWPRWSARSKAPIQIVQCAGQIR